MNDWESIVLKTSSSPSHFLKIGIDQVFCSDAHVVIGLIQYEHRFVERLQFWERNIFHNHLSMKVNRGYFCYLHNSIPHSQTIYWPSVMWPKLSLFGGTAVKKNKTKGSNQRVVYLGDGNLFVLLFCVKHSSKYLIYNFI